MKTVFIKKEERLDKVNRICCKLGRRYDYLNVYNYYNKKGIQKCNYKFYLPWNGNREQVEKELDDLCKELKVDYKLKKDYCLMLYFDFRRKVKGAR